MSRTPQYGRCHLCGQHGKLSFEHVPPRAAFNDKPLLYVDMEKLFKSASLDNLSGKKRQLGAGGYTLCESCNNNTGSWYGGAFVEWAQQGMMIAQGAQGNPTLNYPFTIYPLRVIKQIACMFFSANGPHLCDAHPHLVRFVLNKDVRHLPADIRFYAFYTLSPRFRSAVMTGLYRTDSGNLFMVSEITFPPFGFVMTFKSASPDSRLLDISHLSQYGYNERRTLYPKLPVMPIYTQYPTDYRSRDEVLRDVVRQAV